MGSMRQKKYVMQFFPMLHILATRGKHYLPSGQSHVEASEWGRRPHDYKKVGAGSAAKL